MYTCHRGIIEIKSQLLRISDVGGILGTGPSLIDKIQYTGDNRSRADVTGHVKLPLSCWTNNGHLKYLATPELSYTVRPKPLNVGFFFQLKNTAVYLPFSNRQHILDLQLKSHRSSLFYIILINLPKAPNLLIM